MCKEEVCLCQNLHLRAWALSNDPNVQGLACQRWKWASYRVRLGFALEMRWRGQTSRGSLEWNHCTSLALRGASVGGSGTWSVCIQITCLWKVFWARPSGLKAPGLDLDLLEGLQILSGLRAPQGSLEGSGEEEESRNTLLQPGFGLDGECRRAAGSFCRIRCDAFMRSLCFSETLKPCHRFPTLYFLVHRSSDAI